jgi:hypothetical protein
MEFVVKVIYQKPVYAIEGLAKQGAILDGFSAGLQEYLLSIYCTLASVILDGTAVEEDIDIDQYMDTLFTYWKNGDIEGVIVGAAHYISDYSVIDRLENMGYEVNQVK